MERARVLGNNITLLLNQRGITKESFADALGYSLYEVQKLCDARIFTAEEDVEEIAKYFQIPKNDLYIDNKEKYFGEGFMDCMGKFKRPENREKVLDIFDMYCDIKEILE